jgi:hypothetical protein
MKEMRVCIIVGKSHCHSSNCKTEDSAVHPQTAVEVEEAQPMTYRVFESQLDQVFSQRMMR